MNKYLKKGVAIAGLMAASYSNIQAQDYEENPLQVGINISYNRLLHPAAQTQKPVMIGASLKTPLRLGKAIAHFGGDIDFPVSGGKTGERKSFIGRDVDLNNDIGALQMQAGVFADMLLPFYSNEEWVSDESRLGTIRTGLYAEFRENILQTRQNEKKEINGIPSFAIGFEYQTNYFSLRGGLETQCRQAEITGSYTGSFPDRQQISGGWPSMFKASLSVPLDNIFRR
ncbi:MAG: hypothetical protein JWM96_32 [Alphaproteobacteria bacterium]|nr:hypothetical protein [Alphaproteobacteria bacterium]